MQLPLERDPVASFPHALSGAPLEAAYKHVLQNYQKIEIVKRVLTSKAPIKCAVILLSDTSYHLVEQMAHTERKGTSGNLINIFERYFSIFFWLRRTPGIFII